MKFLIVANGPFQPKSHIEALIDADTTVIALDGAADKLAQFNILPAAIVGDLDSLVGKYDTQIIFDPDQNSTDLQKGIIYADTCGATRIDIICATDGRMDHSLGNIRVLRRFYKPTRPIRIYTDSQILEYVTDNSIIIRGKIGDFCGIMAFPKAWMTTHGLKYETENYLLEFGFSESTSNEFAKTEAKIIIKGEALVIWPRIHNQTPGLYK